MTPGRELDALVAEKVMGLNVVKLSPGQTHFVGPGAGDFVVASDGGFYVDGGRTQFYHVRPYSTSIAAAWEVVEKLRSTEWPYCGTYNAGRLAVEVMAARVGFAVFVRDSLHNVYGDAESQSAPHAICLAALKAVSE